MLYCCLHAESHYSSSVQRRPMRTKLCTTYTATIKNAAVLTEIRNQIPGNIFCNTNLGRDVDKLPPSPVSPTSCSSEKVSPTHRGERGGGGKGKGGGGGRTYVYLKRVNTKYKYSGVSSSQSSMHPPCPHPCPRLCVCYLHIYRSCYPTTSVHSTPSFRADSTTWRNDYSLLIANHDHNRIVRTK